MYMETELWQRSQHPMRSKADCIWATQLTMAYMTRNRIQHPWLLLYRLLLCWPRGLQRCHKGLMQLLESAVPTGRPALAHKCYIRTQCHRWSLVPCWAAQQQGEGGSLQRQGEGISGRKGVECTGRGQGQWRPPSHILTLILALLHYMGPGKVKFKLFK